MERDVIGAHGATATMKDRLMEQSDEFAMWVCGTCGLIANVADTDKIKQCSVCNSMNIARVKLPYGSKLIFQEQMGMNIVPRMLFSPIKEKNIE